MKAAIAAIVLLACASCSAEKPVPPPRTAAPITQAATPQATPSTTPQAKPPVQSDPKGHIDVTEVAIGEVKGRRVVLSAGREGLVQVRDAGTLRPIGKPIPGLAPIEYTVLDGAPLVLVTTRQGTVEAWDLRSRTRRGPALAAGEEVRALTAHEGIAVTWSEEGVKSFDLASGRLRHRSWDWNSGEWLGVADVQGVPSCLRARRSSWCPTICAPGGSAAARTTTAWTFLTRAVSGMTLHRASRTWRWPP